MHKTVIGMILGALLTSAVATAFALTGNAPIPSNGFGLVDGTWLNGLAGGTNQIYQSGLTALGTTSITALALSPGIKQFEIDTVGGSAGVNLPTCVAGGEVTVYNAGSNALTVYPATTINSLTATQDTIDGTYGGAFIAIPVTSTAVFFCPKNGHWAH